MSWQEPKTTWVADDYINPTDWERIAGNDDYNTELHKKLFGKPTSHASTHLESLQVFTADLLNQLESNITAINDFYKFDIGESKTWKSNGNMCDYTDLNRYESAMLKLNNQMQADISIIPTLDLTLGNVKGIKL